MFRKSRVFMVYILLFGLCASVYAADKPLSAEHAYNQGVDFYNKLDYNKAADNFLESMNTQEKYLEQWSAYNLGNALFGQGLAAEKKDPASANPIYKKALNFFKRAIDIDPADRDAKYNYELTTKKIVEQEQKSKQDKQDQKDKQDKKDNQNQQTQQDKQPDKQDKQDQQSQQNQQSQQDKQPQQKDQQSAPQNEQRRQMTKQEAKMLLENFQQSEDKQKEINLYKAQQQQPAPGVKGW
ncbi:MAG: hypothetical protein V1747_03660 [Candidatus Omnitrophota bacterium]